MATNKKIDYQTKELLKNHSKDKIRNQEQIALQIHVKRSGCEKLCWSQAQRGAEKIFVDGVLSWKKHCELNECTK